MTFKRAYIYVMAGALVGFAIYYYQEYRKNSKPTPGATVSVTLTDTPTLPR